MARLKEVKEFLELFDKKFSFTTELIHQATQPTPNTQSIPSHIST